MASWLVNALHTAAGDAAISIEAVLSIGTDGGIAASSANKAGNRATHIRGLSRLRPTPAPARPIEPPTIAISAPSGATSTLQNAPSSASITSATVPSAAAPNTTTAVRPGGHRQ